MSSWMIRLPLVVLALNTSSCGGEKIVTVTFPKKDGNSEYWVCDRDATNCHGRGEGDVDPRLYKPGLDTLSPPIECAHGASRMEIVLRGNRVRQIGYECAQPSTPSGLPGRGDSEPKVGPTGLPDGPTGLPDGPTGLPEDAPGAAEGEAESSEKRLESSGEGAL